MVSSTGCSSALPRVLKDLRFTAEEVPEDCDFRAGRHPLPLNLLLNNLPDGDRVRGRWSGRGTGSSRPDRALVSDPAGSGRLVLEVLLWLVGRYSEQGVMLHVCCKALQCRPFGMTWLEVGARRARRAVGGAWRDSAIMCYSGPGAGRSGGVLPGPVALRALEVASYRRSRGQGQGAPRTCRCIETARLPLDTAPPPRQGAPRTCRCIETLRWTACLRS